ncbi:hypothetical protein Zmor_007880 [Zophobas morio]|uniref:Odorant receptor n=1 Tax=Zophobas morio TaxID=2755281 RepID=A0AA38MQ50_9CUCU|nr:hypothetical protein Zmor_023222 [Zophobas morio]KAJ3663638.1 hypothetical protein Zmor_007880 [Zophobas morio]
MGKVEQYNWKGNFDINIRILRKMGLWPEGEGTYKLGFYMLYSAFMVTLFPTCHILSELADIYFVLDDLETVVGIIYITLIEIMALIKVYFVITRMKIIKERMENLKADWFQPKDREQTLMIEPSITFWKLVYKMFIVACLGCNFFWLIPLIIRQSEEKTLPFLAWYPIDCSETPYFEIAYIYQLSSTVYCTLVQTNVDTLISGFNVYIGCQLDMLSDNLKRIAMVENYDNAGDNLIKCIIYHKQILSFVDGCNKFFNIILFWHLIISGVAIGITMFQLTLVKPMSSEFFSVLWYGLAILVQIFMYCWFGNEVEVKSNLVSYAVFESDWTDLPEDVKKNLIIFITNVLKPIRISVFNVLELSLDTFTRILKTAGSYFALLIQLNEK